MKATKMLVVVGSLTSLLAFAGGDKSREQKATGGSGDEAAATQDQKQMKKGEVVKGFVISADKEELSLQVPGQGDFEYKVGDNVTVDGEQGGVDQLAHGTPVKLKFDGHEITSIEKWEEGTTATGGAGEYGGQLETPELEDPAATPQSPPVETPEQQMEEPMPMQ